MPSSSVVIYDNGLSSQNQDYYPSRYLLQKELIDKLITHTLESDSQSLIGLIPIAQKDNNDILTPTLVRSHLSTFLHRRDLFSKCMHNLALYQAEMSLDTSEFSERNIFMIFGSPIADSDQLMVNIYSLAAKKVNIRVVCFGDAYEFGTYLAQGSSFENLMVLNILPDQDFNSMVFDMFANVSGNQYVDKDIEEAIRRSMIEK